MAEEEKPTGRVQRLIEQFSRQGNDDTGLELERAKAKGKTIAEISDDNDNPSLADREVQSVVGDYDPSVSTGVSSQDLYSLNKTSPVATEVGSYPGARQSVSPTETEPGIDPGFVAAAKRSELRSDLEAELNDLKERQKINQRVLDDVVKIFPKRVAELQVVVAEVHNSLLQSRETEFKESQNKGRVFDKLIHQSAEVFKALDDPEKTKITGKQVKGIIDGLQRSIRQESENLGSGFLGKKTEHDNVASTKLNELATELRNSVRVPASGRVVIDRYEEEMQGRKVRIKELGVAIREIEQEIAKLDTEPNAKSTESGSENNLKGRPRGGR